MADPIVVDYDKVAEALAKRVPAVVEAELDKKSGALIAEALKQFEDSAKVRGAGMVSPDGGTADSEIKTAADWFVAVFRNDVKRLEEHYGSKSDRELDRGDKKAMNEQTGSAGGWTVPAPVETRLLETAAEASIVDRLPAGRRPMELNMTSRTLTVPTLDQTGIPAEGASALDAGVVARWTEESGPIQETEPRFGKAELNAHKLAGYTVASNELNSDSAIALEALLTRLFGRAIGNQRSYNFLRGNGVGKPLGILNAGARYSVTRGTGALDVETADVLAMITRMHPGGLSRAVWMAHPFLLPQIAQLQIGSSGSAVVWGDIRSGFGTSLLGIPLMFGEHMPAPGQPGDLMLVDWSYYLVGNRGGTSIARSEHVRFLNDDIVWRFTHRVDGQPWLDDGIILADGAGDNEVSPFVLLD